MVIYGLAWRHCQQLLRDMVQTKETQRRNLPARRVLGFQLLPIYLENGEYESLVDWEWKERQTLTLVWPHDHHRPSLLGTSIDLIRMATSRVITLVVYEYLVQILGVIS